jgi:Family of unknown function (DUF6516)
VPPKSSLRKIVDDVTLVSCASGPGIIRTEVWEDETGKAARYNLAFINHFLFSRDNGRVLGYDNAHGTHHRHYFGKVESASVTTYEEATRRFYEEVRELRKRKP